MCTPRERRLYAQKYDIDPKKFGVVRFKDGPLVSSKGTAVRSIQVRGQVLELHMTHLYPDDVIALARDMILALDPSLEDKYNAAAVKYCEKAIYAMDMRAMERHGYSHNAKEASLKLPYVPADVTLPSHRSQQEE